MQTLLSLIYDDIYAFLIVTKSILFLLYFMYIAVYQFFFLSPEFSHCFSLKANK